MSEVPPGNPVVGRDRRDPEGQSQTEPAPSGGAGRASDPASRRDEAPAGPATPSEDPARERDRGAAPAGRGEAEPAPPSDGGGAPDFAALYRRLEEVERTLSREGGGSPEERQRRLAARTRALAAAREAPAADGDDMVAFALSGERFAVPTEDVEEILDLRGLAPLPGAPQELAGMIASRSRVVPVIDPRPLLGLSRGGFSDLAFALVVSFPSGPFALAVERVEGRVVVPPGGSPPPGAGPYLRVAGDGLVILDLARLVATLSRGR